MTPWLGKHSFVLKKNALVRREIKSSCSFSQKVIKTFYFRIWRSKQLCRQCSLIEVLSQYSNVNPFPQVKILDQTKLKALADDKLNVTKMIISVLDRVENIVGKG